MKQLIQNPRTGELIVQDVPPPTLSSSGILVENCYSLISIGTERATVSVGKSGLLSKARQRPDLVKQVLDNVKREGLKETYYKVRNRLDRPKALGYSSAGVVIETSSDIEDFRPGDRVACGGEGYASHAEIVFVPKNLCVAIPANVHFKDAAFATIGAIALQAVRQAEVSVGDQVAVIGLGLVGLLIAQILQACGCHVIGLDIQPRSLELARELGIANTVPCGDSEQGERAIALTHGYGVDRVIIAAATASNQPVELAGRITRDKGLVVIVGAVGMSIPRNLYYEKELTLKLSRSYGPGRYDPSYEEGGIDYPIGYVRWTENRNMAAFLQLVADKKLNVERMISHTFPIAQACQGYELITSEAAERRLAILLAYKREQPSTEMPTLPIRRMTANTAIAPQARDGQLHVGIIGAGNFAQSQLLPTLKTLQGVHLQTVSTARGFNAYAVAKKFQTASCTADNLEVLQNQDIRCVFIATRHSLHARLVIQALEQDKHVFVEKPLALSEEEVRAIMEAHSHSNATLMVGFNRRFSPLIQETKHLLDPLHGPWMVHYRINAPFVPKSHWIQNPLEGGGRILGEVCHFVDLIQYLTAERPLKVFAASTSNHDMRITNSDNLNANITFSNGSLGIITYVALGDTSAGKERIEIFRDSSTVIIDDFKRAYFYRGRRLKKMRARGKGHREEIEAFIAAVQKGLPSPIDFASILSTTMTTFRIRESLHKGKPIFVDIPSLNCLPSR